MEQNSTSFSLESFSLIVLSEWALAGFLVVYRFMRKRLVGLVGFDCSLSSVLLLFFLDL